MQKRSRSSFDCCPDVKVLSSYNKQTRYPAEVRSGGFDRRLLVPRSEPFCSPCLSVGAWMIHMECCFACSLHLWKSEAVHAAAGTSSVGQLTLPPCRPCASRAKQTSKCHLLSCRWYLTCSSPQPRRKIRSTAVRQAVSLAAERRLAMAPPSA